MESFGDLVVSVARAVSVMRDEGVAVLASGE